MPNPTLNPTRRDVLRATLALVAAGAGKAFAALDVTGRALAEVQVNGQGPFLFLVDTTAIRSALSMQLASRLGLAGDAGASVPIASLESGALSLKDVQLPVLSSEALVAADGLLGIDGMVRKKLDIDLRNGTVSILPTNDRRAPIGFRVVPARERLGGLLAIEADIGGLRRVPTIIDTGAMHTVATHATQKALGTSAESPATVRVAGVALGQPYLRYGEDEAFAVWELQDKPAVLLGMDVLGFLQHLAIDYRRFEFQFRP